MSDQIVRTLIGTKREETDLIGCPCCGEDVALAIDNYQGEWAATAYCDDCGLTARAEGASKDDAISNLQNIWNTRYEKTCHDISHDSMPVFQCSECGYLLTIRDEEDYTMWHGTFEVLDAPRYCPSCGAKVVDE